MKDSSVSVTSKPKHATRPYFMVVQEDVGYVRRMCTFEWHSGMALSQAHRNVASLHQAIQEEAPDAAPTLEVSTKSLNPLGGRLSALNLTLPIKKLGGRLISVENVFQCAKVFGGELDGQTIGPFPELLEDEPYTIKKKIKECLTDAQQSSATLIGFRQNGVDYPLEPMEGFYFYLYCNALRLFFEKEQGALAGCLQFHSFTDISFNPQKSFNCQSAALAFYLSMVKQYASQEIAAFLKDKEVFYDLVGTATACYGL